MKANRRNLSLSCLVLAGCLGCAAASTPAAPAAPTSPLSTGPSTINIQPAAAPSSASGCTLPHFLGLDQLCAGGQGLLSCIQNDLGTFFPGLESTPALLAITNPANLKSGNPAVAAAASAKADEDAAPQKIKALNYLAKLGCTKCYPDVEKAFLAGLDDCTESVRFAAAECLRDAAGQPCRCCQQTSCCTPAIRKKLNDVGYGKDEKTGCFKEPSPRVRRAARLALDLCGCPPVECNPKKTDEKPMEGPGKADVPKSAGALPEPPGLPAGAPKTASMPTPATK